MNALFNNSNTDEQRQALNMNFQKILKIQKIQKIQKLQKVQVIKNATKMQK